MKIAHLLSGLPIVLTNQEQAFLETHKSSISLTTLNERDLWMAQTLVRKGIYSIDKDNQTLNKN
jgi:hypothetical protein